MQTFPNHFKNVGSLKMQLKNKYSVDKKEEDMRVF